MLTPSLTNWRAQYDRLKRSYARITRPYFSSVEYDDDLHHFMQDSWHLKDWIKYDPATRMRNTIEENVSAYKSLRIAADLANGSKHLNRSRHLEGAFVTSTNVTVHLGQNRPIEVDYKVTLYDGTQTTAEILAREVIKDWDSLLIKLGLLQ